MQAFLESTARFTVTAIQTIAVLVIAIGVIELVFVMVRAGLRRESSPSRDRAAWLGFARWLVAGLTLQLAADIIETTVAPTWDEIGRVAAIAATRTFLNYFLDRDIDEIRARQRRSNASTAAGESS